jgi:hypothetical protein
VVGAAVAGGEDGGGSSSCGVGVEEAIQPVASVAAVGGGGSSGALGTTGLAGGGASSRACATSSARRVAARPVDSAERVEKSDSAPGKEVAEPAGAASLVAGGFNAPGAAADSLGTCGSSESSAATSGGQGVGIAAVSSAGLPEAGSGARNESEIRQALASKETPRSRDR